VPVFLVFLTHELRLNLRQKERVIANFLFFLIFLATFFLLSSNQQISAYIPILFSLLSCLIFSSAEFLKADFIDGTSEQIISSGTDFEIFIAAKFIANWLVCAVPILIASSFIKPEIDFLILVSLVSFLINCICCFCGSLSILGNAAPLIAVIALPLIIPTLLISLGEFAPSSQLLIGLCLFLIPLLIFATAKIVKIAHE